MNDARNALLSILRALPEAAVAQSAASGDWTIKEVVAHITAWEDRLLTVAQKVLWGDGRLVEWIRTEQELAAWNERQRRRLRDWTWAEILRGLMRWTHARGFGAKLRGLWQMIRGVRKKKS